MLVEAIKERDHLLFQLSVQGMMICSDLYSSFSGKLQLFYLQFLFFNSGVNFVWCKHEHLEKLSNLSKVVIDLLPSLDWVDSTSLNPSVIFVPLLSISAGCLCSSLIFGFNLCWVSDLIVVHSSCFCLLNISPSFCLSDCRLNSSLFICSFVCDLHMHFQFKLNWIFIVV